MERKKSKKGNKEEGGKDGESRRKEAWLPKGTEVCRVCGGAGRCVCLLHPIAVLRLTGLDLGEVFQEF